MNAAKKAMDNVFISISKDTVVLINYQTDNYTVSVALFNKAVADDWTPIR